MKKFAALILTIAIMLCTFFFVPMTSLADQKPIGGIRQTKYFTVIANTDNAYFVLCSSTGLANVAQHNWYGSYTGDGNETAHGFYIIVYWSLDNSNNVYTDIWVPSATTNASGSEKCTEIRYSLPGKGSYSFHVIPMDNEQAAMYWRIDSINYWIQDPSWRMTITSGCQVETMN